MRPLQRLVVTTVYNNVTSSFSAQYYKRQLNERSVVLLQIAVLRVSSTFYTLSFGIEDVYQLFQLVL